MRLRITLTVLLLLAALLGTPAPTAQAAPPAGLLPGQRLASGAALRSPNGAYQLAMQADGNLVIYRGRSVVWASMRLSRGNRAVMQTDGNLVVYDARGNARWSSGTYGFPGASLALTNDGNLVVARKGRRLWDLRGPMYDQLFAGQTIGSGESVISAGRSTRLAMWTTGNLVLSRSGRVVWESGTSVKGSTVTLQDDGNLVIYSPSGRARWATRTNGRLGAFAKVQDDGNLVVYHGPMPVWAAWGLGEVEFWPCYELRQGCVAKMGYRGQSSWWYPVDPYGNNCTNYVAFRASRLGYRNPGNLGDASAWAARARGYGLAVDQKPLPGTAAQWSRGSHRFPRGHVAFVDWVSRDGTQIATSETGYSRSRVPSTSGRRLISSDSPDWPNNFIHFRR